MSVVKLPYYPQVVAEYHETRFGAHEVPKAVVYNKPLSNGKIIVKVDALACLYDMIGFEPFINRELMYCVLAGESDTYDVNKIFASSYRKFKKLMAYVNDKYYYGNPDIPIYERAVLPLCDMVKEYCTFVHNKLNQLGGKYLVEDRYNVYYAFNIIPDVSDLKGAIVIC